LAAIEIEVQPLKRMVIRDGTVLLPDGGLEKSDVALDGSRIGEIGRGLTGEDEIDASEAYVLPGLIDLHLHGICRESLEASSLHEYARLEAERGATTIYPTFFGPPELTIELLARHRRETDELRALPQVGGFRLESPYLAATGAGVNTDLAPISEELTHRLLTAGGGHIRIWDVSPELDHAPEAIAGITAKGIVCSLAHTRATFEQALTAVDAGARLVTHMFDTFVLPDITDPDPGVYPAGLTDYLLVEDRVVCEIIGDGTHVHPLLVEIALRCKGLDGVVLVTDSNFGAGLAPGRYATPKWGDILINGPNEGARLPDRNMELAGSALAPIDNFRNAIRIFGKDIAAASRLCSSSPARLMGLNKGEIAVGKDADLVVLSRGLDVRCTVVAGAVAYPT
jgi:N-acetylglucosamine-6-phosphate deacetylase